MPLYPVIPLVFLGTYVLLLLGALIQQPVITVAALTALTLVGVVSWLLVKEGGSPESPDHPIA